MKFKKVKKSVKKATKSVTKQVKRTAKQVGKQVERSAKQAEKQLKRSAVDIATGGLTLGVRELGKQLFPEQELPEMPDLSNFQSADTSISNVADVQMGGGARRDEERRRRTGGQGSIRSTVGF